MIEINGVSKSYDGKKQAVKQLSLKIEDGEIIGLIGPNGAGKSTLLKMIVGILEPDEGQISINDHDITREPELAKREFAYVSDNPDKLLRLKGHEYLRFIADVYEVPEADRLPRVEELTRSFGLYENLDQQIQSYSHGMRQKLMVCSALLVNPNVWILDEPMVGLDPRAAFNMKEMMRKHADAGKIVLFSTHVLEVAEKLVDRIAVIAGGELKFVGKIDELRAQMQTEASLEDLFLKLTDQANPSGDEFPVDLEQA
ncbi:MAG: ABC transporter ATP-binding protein [Eubacteriales bacterium]|nr:ABC transporter ATP-binding protein [Eubacteriales bacterium]